MHGSLGSSGHVATMKFKRLFWLLISPSLGCLVLGFISWMLSNPDYKHETNFSYWFNMVAVVLILLGEAGLMGSTMSFFRNWSHWKRLGASAMVAVLFSFLSFAILFLEFGVLNFGDSDLPPYQPDTPFERASDFVWFLVTIGGGLLWLFVLVYFFSLLFGAIKRHLA
jgi:hypothetical protein